jgi:hypothetical protein
MVNSQIGIEDIFGQVIVSSNYSGATSLALITLDFTIQYLKTYRMKTPRNSMLLSYLRILSIEAQPLLPFRHYAFIYLAMMIAICGSYITVAGHGLWMEEEKKETEKERQDR